VSAGPAVDATGSHVVIAELGVKPEHLDAFVARARLFAAECRALEPGCRQFQVVRLETTAHHVLFFEVYDDDVAFDAHRASGHLARFRADFQEMLTGEQPLRQGRREQEEP
jgi:quinol monooxygenase YgiN